MRNVHLTGIEVNDYREEFPAAREALRQLAGLQMRTEVVDGLEKVPLALRRLMRGDTQGKVVVRVTPQPRL
jgi:NADPH-dependent curcumin reductase CurA